jgi:hypothetical protein
MSRSYTSSPTWCLLGVAERLYFYPTKLTEKVTACNKQHLSLNISYGVVMQCIQHLLSSCGERVGACFSSVQLHDLFSNLTFLLPSLTTIGCRCRGQ